MKQGFSLQFAQNLSLTPALQQAIKLLQMSSLELHSELQTQLEQNPFLALETTHNHASIAANGSISAVAPASWLADRSSQGMQSEPLPISGDPLQARQQEQYKQQEQRERPARDAETDFEAYDARATDTPLYNSDTHDSSNNNTRSKGDNDDDSDEYLGWVQADTTTLREHLHAQARLIHRSRANAVTLGVLGLIIDTVQPTGYFEESLESLHQTIASYCDVPNDALLHEAVRSALTLLQSLDPCGVGAFSVQDCLRLQLLHVSPADCVLDAKSSTHKAALRIVMEGFDHLVRRDRASLKKQLKLDDTTLASAIDLIRKLDPEPGLALAPQAIEYAMPELLAIKVGGLWQARLNAAVVPALRVADTHAKFIKGKYVTLEVAALQTHLQNAKALVRTVQQHFDTVFRVGQAIVAAQQDFFSFGATKIKPMVLRDIADVLGLHESTVSRVTTKKYLQSPHGVFELKYFFSSGLASDNGDDTSSTAIKAHLQPLIQGESPHKPLSDQALTDALSAAGFPLARRTVAKYREQLGYPPAHARKPL